MMVVIVRLANGVQTVFVVDEKKNSGAQLMLESLDVVLRACVCVLAVGWYLLMQLVC